jgi:argininosuccinate synthase
VRGFNVISFMAQVGQMEYLGTLGEKAVQLGADTSYIADLRHRFINDFILPCLRANARYESYYLLSSALSRPLIAQELVRIAEEENCTAVAHGSRGFGNDHIRFNNCIHALNPELEIITPLHELGLRTIKDDIQYAGEHNIPVESPRETLYNLEYNLWGGNIQLGGLTAGTWPTPPRDTYIMTVPVEESPDKPTEVSVTLEKGMPVSLNGEKTDTLAMIEMLNKIGGRNAIGRIDMVEDKISGEKSREIYEAPAATILCHTFQALGQLVLPEDLLYLKAMLSQKYAHLAYHGEWFSPLRESLDAFFLTAARKISGTVRLKLFKGNCTVSKIEI